MKLWLPLLVLWATAAPRAEAQATSAPVRLAIVVESPVAAEAGDLLTVEFSKRAGLQLLERAEIDRVYREQALSAANRDYLRLGRILGADGLLVLETINSGASPMPAAGFGARAGQFANQQPGPGSQFLVLRLVAVQPAIVLASERFPWPVQGASDWAAGLANHFVRLIPKLGVARQDAVPVSVVNFHSAIQSAEARELEQQLTRLVIERLTRERQLFVLERRDMQLLTAEKELGGLEDSKFWSGSYLLEGTLDRDGYSRERMTLTTRLVPPQGGAPLALEVSAARTNLAAAADLLAGRILTGLKLATAAAPWNPADEAERYFEEAKWEYRWKLYPQAAAASESSWALGRHAKDVAALRIRSYYDDGVDTAGGWYDVTRKLVAFGPAVQFTPGNFVFPYDGAAGGGERPDGERFGRVHRALELYCQGFRQFIATDPNPGWEWHDLGIDLLEGASYWLRHYYYMPEGRAGQEETIADVQALAKEMANLIGGHPAYTNDFGRNRFFTPKVNWGLETGFARETTPAALLETKVNWGAYWTATPEEGVALYRSIVAGGSMPNIRQLFLKPDFLELTTLSDPFDPRTMSSGGILPTPGVLSYLCGWKWPDRQRVLKVWHGFIDELCDSTNLSIRLEGLFLRCAQSPTDAQRDRSFRELLGLLQQHGDALFEAGLASNLVGDVQVVLEPKGRNDAQREMVEARRQVWRQWAEAVADANGRRAHAAKLEELKNYLAASAYDFGKFNSLFFQFDYQADDARQLLPSLSLYRSNLTVQAGTLARELAPLRENRETRSSEEQAKWAELSRQRGRLGSYASSLNRLEQLLQSKLHSTPGTSTNPATVPTTVASAPATARGPTRGPFPNGPPRPGQTGLRKELDLASLGFTNPLPVTRFWPVPDRLPQANERSGLAIASCCFREGRLWVDARASRFGTYAGEETYFNRAAIFAVDLDSFQSQGIPLDPRSFTLFNASPGSAAPSFEVHDGWLYVSSANVVRRYSLKSQEWQDLPVPLQGHARISFVRERMFITTADSILESTPDGKDVRILASSRRQPALTKLDAIPAYGFAPIVAGPDDSAIVFVGGKFCECARDAADWTVLPAPKECSERDVSGAVHDGGLVLICRPYGKDERIVALWQGSRLPELLLVRPSRIPAITGSPALREMSATDPRWQLPESVRALDQVLCLDADSLWVLVRSGGSPPRAGGPGIASPPTGFAALLFRFRRDASQPSAIPLQLQLPADSDRNRVISPLGLNLVSTPKGMVIACTGIAGIGVGLQGFWFIPQDELAGRAAAGPEARVAEGQARDKR